MRGLIFLVCVCVAWGAPMGNKGKEDGLESIQNTEKEIEELADLAAESGSQDVGFETQKEYSFHNINGHVDNKAKTENKVFNPKTGKVISDLQQETLGDDASRMKTKLDIPAANVHQSVISENKEDQTDNDYSKVFKFTPAAVAEYLFRSGEFEELEEALADLVNSSIMTQQQADTYREDVRKEYNVLVQQAAASNMAATMNLPRGEQNERFLSDYSTLNDIYSMFGYKDVIPHLGIDELQSKDIMRIALSRATSLIEVIRALMDEWLTKATITGDPDAANLLSDILRHVSQDSNPDDLSQMREILYDIFANEVLNSLEKRPLGDYEDLNETLNEIPSGKSENEKQETVEKQDKIDEKVKTQEPNTKTEKENREEKETNAKNLKM
ncbi:uncharacterized protein LOC125662546 [Ostrea edulis]|uniref:uncharacterized protein LOC125662546 n=1 Tax=Ostrea edulis TaxID=37623 RepID=UPI0024AF00B9|nr:uncharacterized protein LOC125662546 [Ostrea edulis]